MERKFYFYTDQMTVGYGGRPLIKNIRMEVEKGEILTLIGPNGAGKSTIFKSITRQLAILGGSVWVDGREMGQMSGKELARKQAVVLTGRMETEYMTCGEVVASGRYPYTGWLGIPGKEDLEKVDEALALVSGEELKERDFAAISDGQRQKILLARAICQEPELIILDEPTSYLDVKHKLEFLTVLRKLVRERNMAVVMSLHELDLAQKVSDYIVCVGENKIWKCGTPEEIFKEEYIRRLYDLDNGYYSEIFGSVEIKRDAGKWGERSPAADVSAANDAGKPGTPEVFVIAGGGSGASVFRQLQREGIPFAAGVLHRNDIDYELARMLADCVVPERAYERIGEEAYAQALRIMRDCGRVICCLKDEEFGEMNDGNRRLLREAEKAGLNVERRT